MSEISWAEPRPLANEDVIDPTVRSAKRGDDRAFAALYDAHAARVYGLCLRLCGDPVAATDLVQDVFVRIWERLGSYRGESSLSTWIHRVAVNTVFQEGRTSRRRSLRVAIASDLKGIGGVGDRPELDAPAPLHDPGVRLDIDQCIAGLPPGARAVFVLHDVEGYSHSEIGTQLGIAEGTSKAHLFRARRLLREALER